MDVDTNTSFLYATLDGFEKMEPDAYTHRFPLSDELIESSFFDVVGDGKSRTVLGRRGLKEAIKRWEKVRDAVATSEFMGMSIRPRIEVIMSKAVKPTSIEEESKDQQK